MQSKSLVFSHGANRWILALLAAATWLSLGWVWRLGQEPRPRATTLHGTMKMSGRMHGFSLDGQTLITSNPLTGMVTLWNVSTGLKHGLKGQPQNTVAVTIAPDANLIATCGSDGSVQIWDAHTLEILTQFASQPGNVHLLAIAPDNKMLASVDSDGSVRLCEVATGKDRRVPLCALSVEFAPDGKTLAVIKYASVSLWNVATGQEGRTLTTPRVWRAAFSPDGRKLATSHANGNVTLWDLDTGQAQALFAAPEASLLAFAPDGKTLAVGFLDQSAPATQFGAWVDFPGLGQLTDESATVLIDVTDGKELMRLRGRLYGTFFPNSKNLVTWHCKNDRVEVWDIPPQRALHPVFTWITLGLALASSAACAWGVIQPSMLSPRKPTKRTGC